MGKNTADARCLGVKKSPGFRPKNLIGQPWRVAIALQEWGWYLREDIIWHKPAPMPESCVDRCTKAHEYIFHLTKPDKCLIFRSRDTNEFIFERKLTKEEKAQKVETASGHLMPRWMVLDYYYNQDAIREPVTGGTHARIAQNLLGQTGSGRANGNTRQDRPMKAVVKKRIAGWDYGPGKHRSVDHAKASSGETKFRLGKPASSTLEGSYQGRHDGVTSPDQRTPKLDLADPETDRSSAGERMGRGEGWRNKYNESFAEATSGEIVDNRNARSVWTIPSRGYAGAHFATFPEELAYKCLLVGCRPGGVVCDPFGGSGTTAEMAKKLNLNSIMIDINPNNVPLMQERLNSQQDPLF